ncbi:MAG: endonuclease [Gammaproteobacteria bacterium]|nr:MAG: endonuclease [Gammaproteobacteria bacterium]
MSKVNKNRHIFYVATSNLLNFANPHRVFYKNAKAYDDQSYQTKLNGLTQLLAPTQANVIAVQEIWDKDALIDLAINLGFDATNVIAPLASNDVSSQYTKGEGAKNTPAVGFISNYKCLDIEVLEHFCDKAVIDIPDLGKYAVFNRPALMVTFEIAGKPVIFINAHLKSKRPHFLRDANGSPLEDIENPNIRVRAKLRSLCMRAAEAAAIRMQVIKKLANTHCPLILMGDMNDVTMSVTTQLMAETGDVNYNRSMRDTVLFDATRIQTKYGWMHDVAYSHIHQGMPEIIDQIFVSEEFLNDGKFSVGYVERVDYFNDHLKWDYKNRASDHGVVRAKLVLNAVD